MLSDIQEPTLFSGTIYQNVVDGLTGTSLVNLPEEEKVELVKQACREAYAHDFVEELPNVRIYEIHAAWKSHTTDIIYRGIIHTLESAILSLEARSSDL